MKKAKDYIIFPLDVPGFDEAMKYVNLLKDHVGLFKVGLELFISQGPAILNAVLETAGRKVFLDLKLHDIPATVSRAFMVASHYGPEFVTIHCDVGDGILKEVAANNPGDTKILAITVLTSQNRENLARLGYAEQYANDLSRLVLLKARLAREAGCHGVVCSGHEAGMLRQALGPDLIIVTPGIRPAWTLVQGDDQRRIVTPEAAVRDGADYLVIGRPIRDAEDPREAAKMVANEIEAAL